MASFAARLCRVVLPLVVLACACTVQVAGASQIIDRNATHIKLLVNANGEALISYRAAGQEKHVLAWGAINAIAPTRSRSQVAFQLDYAGGWGKYFLGDAQVRSLQTKYNLIRAKTGYLASPTVRMLAAKSSFAKNYWKTSFGGSCGHYDGPPLAWQVEACKAPDGSYWALQAWQRQLPDYGLTPTPTQAVWELHLSHWTGVLPVLTISTNWAWHQWNHLFGTFVYNASPVYGFGSTSKGVPLDSYGRNVYVDTFDSAYVKGWSRENSFLTHSRTGAFCYSVNPHGSRPAGTGTMYRATIIGPGVTPDVMWQGSAPAPYDAATNATANAAIAALGDPLCQPH